jgi:hypothetical protein
VLNVIEKIILDAIPVQKANRDFRVKFPDDVLQESLAGQLWFGAEVQYGDVILIPNQTDSTVVL